MSDAMNAKITREQIALALCCPDPVIRCRKDTCGCGREYHDQVEAMASLFRIDDEQVLDK